LSKNLADAVGIRRLSEVEVWEKSPYLQKKEKFQLRKSLLEEDITIK
jgi:hypothetical protein